MLRNIIAERVLGLPRIAMNFAFTEEQDAARAARRARSSRASREPEWKELAELGWTGVSVAEELGGAGLGFLEEAVLFEELGRALYAGPYFATVGLALPALGDDELARVAAGEERWSAEVDGLVPDLGSVDWVVDRGGRRAAPRASRCRRWTRRGRSAGSRTASARRSRHARPPAHARRARVRGGRDRADGARARRSST